MFKHVPLSSFWYKIMHKTHVEVPNNDPPDPSILDRPKTGQYYWFASVIQLAGYYAKLRYVGYEDDASKDFWMHMCDPNVHHMGWASDPENQVPLVPPNAISLKTNDWKAYLLEKLHGLKTLPKGFNRMVNYLDIFLII